jgi:aminoglycoside 6'-N-acetyltransferase
MDLFSERLNLHEAKVGDLPRLREIIQAPGTAEWWGEYEGSADDDVLLEGWTIRVDGQIIGWVGAEEEPSTRFASVGLDIMIAPEAHGKGYGPEALRAVIDHFAERGHHRFTIDPAVTNERAIKVYREVGFRPIGTARQYERLSDDGEWLDGLLMDLIVSDLE